MIRLLLGILLMAGLVWGISWMMGLDQTITINTGDFLIQPSLGQLVLAVIILAGIVIFIWAALRRLIELPYFFNRTRRLKRLQRGVNQLSASIIANESGLFDKARLFAQSAAKNLPNNIAAKLILAKSAAQSGHLDEARDLWRAMIEDEHCAPIALKGLFDEAQKRQNPKACLIFSRKAIAIAPKTKWANRCVFDDFVRHRKFKPALEFVQQNKHHHAFDVQEAQRHLVILNTALAQDYEADDEKLSLEHAKAALKLDKSFVPAALIAARLLAKSSKYRTASNLLTRAYKVKPHPHLAQLYGDLRRDLTPAQQLARVEKITQYHPLDASIVQILAQFALKADQNDRAKQVLAPFAHIQPSKNICALMAKIESGDGTQTSKARQWLSASLHAPLDPCWTAEGMVVDEWMPIVPNTQKFDAFEWQVPMHNLDASNNKVQLPEIDLRPLDAPAKAVQ